MKRHESPFVAALFIATLAAPHVALATDESAPPAPVQADNAPTPSSSENTTQSAPAPQNGAAATTQSNAITQPADAARPAFHPWFVHLNLGVPVYTTVGPWVNPNGGNVAAQSFTPANRFALTEMIGVGYWVHPHVRLTLSFQFAEMLTSQALAQPPNATTLTGLTFMSAIAWAAFTYGPVFVGVGALAGPRWMGNGAHNWVYADAGIFTCLGASLPLGAGYVLGLAVQAPVTFNPAVNLAIVPAAFVAKRF